MNRLNKYLTFILAAAIIFSAIPVHPPEDISRDNCVDLKDVILLAQQMSEDGDVSSNLPLRHLVSSLQIVAGMKTVIKAANDDAGASTGLNSGFLLSEKPTMCEPQVGSRVPTVLTSFVSQSDVPPDPPPPRRRTAAFYI